MAGLAGGNSSAQRLIQYVVIRGDLHKALSWPLGAVITQACHAATAAIHLYYSDQSTVDYLRELDSMHKVVLEMDTWQLQMKYSEVLLQDVEEKMLRLKLEVLLRMNMVDKRPE
ncbi:putative peptidyl-tRNA hydrolase PTRHD1 isoform X2 [Protopterus annectens]|uniref:putative peptidyl-tRNA hydrolase PTRHD1 isoform X2 n=1 Tax=Protopterus annectens TaxID=7888 RepID=UPI001CFB55EE|nr:putative peptidyl-tRNA hydrolase PTRHD1 isoform X2 [Protopterus annectens]